MVIIKDNNGISKGFGFVTYEDRASADACLERYKDKAMIDGKAVEVKPAVPRERSHGPKSHEERGSSGCKNALDEIIH